MGNVIRFQFEIDQEHMNELESLMKLGGLKTKKELLNNALTLLRWAVKQTGRGSTIAAIDERDGVYKELSMPFLDAIAASGKLTALRVAEPDNLTAAAAAPANVGSRAFRAGSKK
jgi:hypothetical protein